MTQEQRDDAHYEAIMIVNELHKTIDYSVYCRLIDLIDMLGLPDETCAVKPPKDAPCDYCNCTYEQKQLFHENNYKPHTCMESYIMVSKPTGGKRFLIEVDLWDGANAWAAFEINYCPMCGRKLTGED